MPDFPSLADLDVGAPPSSPSALVEPTLEWLASEGFRARVDDDGDLQLHYEGHDLFVLFEEDDPGYARVLAPGVWRCEDSSEERFLALTVGNQLNDDLKAVKISVRPGGAVHAAVELLVPGFDALRAVLPRALDALVVDGQLHAVEADGPAAGGPGVGEAPREMPPPHLSGWTRR